MKPMIFLLALAIVSVWSCNSPAPEGGTNGQTNSPEENNFPAFLSQFPVLGLPLTLGSPDFDDNEAFPAAPVLSKGSTAATELYESLNERENTLLPLGRIFKDDESVLLLCLEVGIESKRIYLLAFSQKGELHHKTEIANCMINGEYEAARILPSRCLVKSSQFLTLSAEGGDEIVEEGAVNYFTINSDGKVIAGERCD